MIFSIPMASRWMHLNINGIHILIDCVFSAQINCMCSAGSDVTACVTSIFQRHLTSATLVLKMYMEIYYEGKQKKNDTDIYNLIQTEVNNICIR